MMIIYSYTIIPNETLESTTVKVSKENVRRLAALQRSFGTRSMDETIEMLVRKKRKEALDAVFGADRGKLGKFTEEDRAEDRD